MRGRVATVVHVHKLCDSAMCSFLRTWNLDGWECRIIVRGGDVVSLSPFVIVTSRAFQKADRCAESSPCDNQVIDSSFS